MSSLPNPALLAVLQAQFPSKFPPSGVMPRVQNPPQPAPAVNQPAQQAALPVAAAEMEHDPPASSQNSYAHAASQQQHNNVHAGNVGNSGPQATQPGANPASAAGGNPSAQSNTNFQALYWGTWGPISNELVAFGEGYRASIDGARASPQELSQLNQYNKVEKGIATLAELLLIAFTALDTVVPSVNNNFDMVQKNVISGNLTTTLDKSDKYNKTCNDLTRADVETKVIEMDYKQPMTSKDGIMKKAKEMMGTTKFLKNSLKRAHVEPLGRETKPSKKVRDQAGNLINTVPVIITSKNKDEKINLERALKKKGFTCAFHWPSEIVEPMKHIRETYQKFSSPNLDLTDKYLLIRPNTDTGKSINIFYRSKEKGSKFQYLETIRTPASYDLCTSLNEAQPTKSKFVTLFQ